MNVRKAVDYCLDYHRANSRKNTVMNYEFVLCKFAAMFGDRALETISTEEILSFLSQISQGKKQGTKRCRFAILNAFFSLISNSGDSELQNPCDSPMLRKTFRSPKYAPWDTLEKETVDEIIFKIDKIRDRLLVELMARGGLRVSEVLKLTPGDVEDQKLILRDPKSGKEQEVVFIPRKVADRLREYIRERGIEPGDRIFPIGYAAARAIVKKAGDRMGIHLRPHDLRRHSATYASRSGTPIEIVSKVILRHSNLSTTQLYLGKVTDVEAMRWIEGLYG
jgi:integrase/recombinase XerD